MSQLYVGVNTLDPNVEQHSHWQPEKALEKQIIILNSCKFSGEEQRDRSMG
jgi:hypothetical protein